MNNLTEIVEAIAVTSKSGGIATVTINGIDVVVNCTQEATVAAGNSVLVGKTSSGRWFVLGRTGTSSPTPPADPQPKPPSPKPTVKTGKKIISPVETRSRQGSKWRSDNTDVYQGQFGGNGNHYGCAFYGNSPGSLSGKTVTRATINVKRQSSGGVTAAQSTTLRLMTNKTRPSGAPTLTSSTSGPSLKWGAKDTSFDIPTSWAQAMVDGTAGGLCIFDSGGSPYVILEGKGDYSPSFTMTIYWRT